MLILDKLLLSPIYATIWVARRVHDALQREQEAEAERLTAELSELYMMLETSRITEAEFAAREKVLLDRLDAIQKPEHQAGQETKPKKKRAVAARRAA